MMNSSSVRRLDLKLDGHGFGNIDSPITPSSPSSKYTKSSLVGMTDTMCPYRGIALSFWDNILGPRILHVWKTDNAEPLRSDLLSHITSQVLSCEICRDPNKCDIDYKFYNLPHKGVIVPAFVFSAKNNNLVSSVHALMLVLAQSELNFYLEVHDVLTSCMKRLAGKLRIILEKNPFYISVDVFSKYLSSCVRPLSNIHSASLSDCVKISDTAFCPEHNLEHEFLAKCISSHLMTFGRTLVLGDTADRINLLLYTLSMFNSPTERRCSMPVCVNNPQTYHHDFFLQGQIKSQHKQSLPMTEIVASKYPTTIIDLSSREVKQTQAYNEHVLHRYETLKNELICLKYGHFEGLVVLEQELYSVSAYPDTLVQVFMKEIFELPEKCWIRESFITQFMRVLHKKAHCLIEYAKAESFDWTNPLRNQTLKKMRQDLNLNAEGDFRIILAVAEKMNPGIYCFIRRHKRVEKDQMKTEIL